VLQRTNGDRKIARFMFNKMKWTLGPEGSMSALRLPQFDLVPFWIIHPRKAAVVLIHALGVDSHTVGLEFLQQAVDVLHTQVQHEGLLGIEVVAVALERRENRGSGILLPDPTVVLVVDAEVLMVPLGKRLVVVRAEEESANASDVSGHGVLICGAKLSEQGGVAAAASPKGRHAGTRKPY